MADQQRTDVPPQVPSPQVIWKDLFGRTYYLFERINPAALVSSGILLAEELPDDRFRSIKLSEGGNVKVTRCAGGLVNVSIGAALALQRDARFSRFRARLLADSGLPLVRAEEKPQGNAPRRGPGQ